jgi:hypothetical protein
MKLPLILIELDSLDITFCDSLAVVGSCLCPQDSSNCEVFDSDGLIINLVATSVSRKMFYIFESKSLELSVVPSSSYREDRLRALLLEHLKSRKKAPNSMEMPTSELLELCKE